MATTLKLALVHCRPTHGQYEQNQSLLLQLNERAARMGAQIILNTEMGLSGYGFDTRPEIATLLQHIDGQAVRAFGSLCKKNQVYVALGLAERDPRTDIFYNSAILLGPDGEIQAHRRKVTAEAKWACPGPARQNDMAQTPWGQVGLLICSETYFSLIPRAMALKGADLILVPANWPPGGIDPLDLWRVRSLENGIYLAACNRGGKDKRLDMDQARSGLFSPWGQDLLEQHAPESGIYLVDIPLQDGRLASAIERPRRLASRKPGCYHYIYSHLNRIQNLTTYLDLPEPGTLHVHVLGQEQDEPVQFDELRSRLAALPPGEHRLAVLPALHENWIAQGSLGAIAGQLGIHLVSLLQLKQGPEGITYFEPGQPPRSWTLSFSAIAEPPVVDLGPARVGLAPAGDLLHPELALAMAKRGCDLVAASGGRLSPDQQAVLGLRNLERASFALAHGSGGLICTPPEGHEAGQRLETQGSQTCHLALDTSLTRNKPYEERLDYELLLEPASSEAP